MDENEIMGLLCKLHILAVARFSAEVAGTTNAWPTAKQAEAIECELMLSKELGVKALAQFARNNTAEAVQLVAHIG